MEKKLDSAQRRFNPSKGKGKTSEPKVNQFDVDFEEEVRE